MIASTHHSGMMKLGEASRLLSEVRSIDDAKDLADKAAAAQLWAARAKMGIEVQNHATEIRVRAERMAGMMLACLERGHGPGRGKRSSPEENLSSYASALSTSCITKKQASTWQRLAEIPDGELGKRIAAVNDKAERLTVKGILSTTSATGHDGDSWMTPSDIIERARGVLGAIDLDPASSDEANKTVKAAKYFTAEASGLGAERWSGRVWLNPPYSQPLIAQFIGKLINDHRAKCVTSAILLVNASTDTVWAQALLKRFPVCFTAGRLSFVAPGGKAVDGNRVGQALYFLGCDMAKVTTIFAPVGAILFPSDGVE